MSAPKQPTGYWVCNRDVSWQDSVLDRIILQAVLTERPRMAREEVRLGPWWRRRVYTWTEPKYDWRRPDRWAEQDWDPSELSR